MTGDEFDEEFKRLTEDLQQEGTSPIEEEPQQLDNKRGVALVLSPLDKTEALEGFLRMVKLAATVVKVDHWTAAYLVVEEHSTPEEEIASLLTGSRPVPEPADQIARAISKASRFGSIALVSWLSENEGFEPGVSGIVTAKRYIAGEPKEDIAGGIILGGLDDRVEDLLLGRTKPEDYDDEPKSRFFGRRKK